MVVVHCIIHHFVSGLDGGMGFADGIGEHSHHNGSSTAALSISFVVLDVRWLWSSTFVVTLNSFESVLRRMKEKNFW